MNAWIKNVLKSYKECGEEKTIKWLYIAEKMKIIAIYNKKKKYWICPVCKTKIYEPFPYCIGCGSELIYHKTEKEFDREELSEWIPSTIKPNMIYRHFLLYNVLGEKYYSYCESEKVFENIVKNDDIVAYCQISEKEADIFNRVCKKTTCNKCIHLERENGICVCKYEDRCNLFMLNDISPKYRRPYYKEK